MVIQWSNLLLEGLQTQSLPLKPIHRLLQAGTDAADDSFRRILEESLAYSLVHPGHWLQRGLFQLAGLLEWLLPVAATVWGGQYLVSVYWLALDGKAPFLGLNFAVHSLLLIAFAWLAPWFFHRWLKPSPRVIIRRGLLEGIRRGCDRLVAVFESPWDQAMKERGELLGKLEGIIQRFPRSIVTIFTF